MLTGPSLQLDDLITAILSSMSSAQKSEVKAWEEEITTCVHTNELVQPAPKRLEPSGGQFGSLWEKSKLTILLQDSLPVPSRAAASLPTSGFASPVDRSVVGGSNTAAAGETVTASLTRNLRGILLR